MKPALAVALLGLAAASAALAQDPPAKAPAPPAPKDGVELKLTAKPETVLRFRFTTSSGREVGGKTDKQDEESRDFTVKVKAARPDGGLDVEVTVDTMRVKSLEGPAGETVEIDTSKPAPENADMKLAMMSDVTRAMTGRAFTVALDAHGAAAAVTGFREVVSAGLKGTAAESLFPVASIFDDDTCMKFVAPMFEASPSTALAVGGKATGQAKHEIASGDFDFDVDWTLTAATADDATVDSKFAWKPGAEATKGGAKAEGGGTSTAKFSRKDGFVLSMKRRLDAKRETEKMKASSHADWTIERLPEPPAKAPETK